MGLCDRYHWEPGFWRTLGWRQLQALIRAHNTLMRRRASPGRWQGRDDDPWWQEQDARRRALRGY